MQDAANRSSTFLDEQIEKIASGDKSALAALYECAKTSVYTYSFSVLRTPHDAEDVLSDTMLEIWRSAPKYRSMGKPMAWIITIARNLCLMKLRQRAYTAAEPLDPSIRQEVESKGLEPEDRVLIRSMIDALPDTDREIVILHAVSGLKHREIADILKLPLSTVLSKYNRAIKKLRKTLEQTLEGALK